MKSRNQPAGKETRPERPSSPEQPHQPKLSVRTALVLTLALLAAIGDAVLLYVARQAAPLIVISAVVALVAAYKFLDGLIE